MNRMTEIILLFIMREHFLHRFEEEVPTTGKIIDVFLKKETEYIVRGRMKKGRGIPILSIADSNGNAAPVLYNDKTCVSLIPENDSLYRIIISFKPVTGEQQSAAIAVSLSCAMQTPPYVAYDNSILPQETIRPALRNKKDLTEYLPELKRA